jgi:DmsE family decaheme c-type cytochrome
MNTQLKSKLRSLLVIVTLMFAMGAVTEQSLAKRTPKEAKDPPAAPKYVADTNPADYVGQDTCKACHEDMFNQVQRTPHFKTALSVPLTAHPGPQWQGCEACHGPGKAHAEAMAASEGDPAKIEAAKKLIFHFEGVSPEEISARCLACHNTSQEHANFTRSQHASNGVTCLNCHSPHHAKVESALLVERTPALCFGCHTEQKADFAKPFRHRVNEGLIQCQDCHNVHGGDVLERSLRTSARQDFVCFKCHSDKQGPFVFEHAPVRTEGCISCHTPHGSVNPRLLRVSQVNLLCLQCHTVTGSRITTSGSTLGNPVPGTPSFHNHGTDFFQACTLCHTTIHGSNGNAFFFR